jgi:hypothetical protein
MACRYLITETVVLSARILSIAALVGMARVSSAALVAHYPFDGDATEAVAGGASNHGIENGGVGYSAGQFGQALDLDGVDDYVVIPDGGGAEVGAADYTIAFWLNSTDDDGTFLKTGTSSAPGNAIRALDSGNFGTGLNGVFQIDDDISSPFVGLPDPAPSVDGNWHHYAWVRDATNTQVTLYLDGAPATVSTVSAGANPFNFAANDVSSPGEVSHIGVEVTGNQNPGTNFLDGMLDDLRFYDHALSQSEVQALGVAEPFTPIGVGLRKQLFIDDHVVASTSGTKRQLHQPVKHPGNPIISPPAPQPGNEELLHLGGSVIYDQQENLFKMWYEANNASRTHAAVAYATSTDGINWDMPCFNKINYPEWDAPGCAPGQNNFVFDETVINFYAEMVVSVFKDEHETDAARRYKMVYRKDDIGAGTGSVWTAVSPDGIRWSGETGPIIQDADSFHSALWDPALGKYVVHSRFNRNNHPTLPPQRQVLQSESDDFRSWSTYGVILAPDAQDPPDTQFYNMEWMPYEDVFIGFPAVFHTESDRLDVQLAFSRDNRNWVRAGNREVFIPNSPKPGDYDYGMIWNVLQHPIVVDDEIFIYYNGAKGLHGAYWSGDPQGGVIGLAKLRLDGFVSIVDDTGPGPGTLTTKPLTTSGTSLVVNADASAGSIQVEVLDAAGAVVPGFGKADADPITGDDVRHVVTWNGDSSLANLPGGPFSLKFHVDGADLYSFVFSRPGAVEK